MTPEEVAVIADLIGERMEQVYGEVEALKTEVREVVAAVQQSMEVLHGNELALMGEFQKVKGNPVADFMVDAGDAWRRFLINECAARGIKVIVPKGETDG